MLFACSFMASGSGGGGALRRVPLPALQMACLQPSEGGLETETRQGSRLFNAPLFLLFDYAGLRPARICVRSFPASRASTSLCTGT